MEIGSLWNGWKVDKFIGEGSFGKVYRIIREEFGHTYESALKVIEIPQNQSEFETVRNEGMTKDSVTAYFQSMVEEIVDEFSLMAKLKGNTNIVSYEDHSVVPLKDRFGWRIYIRMELLTPLYEYMRNNTFSVREVIQLGIDLCRALEMCQKYNIIHRDIKPENIFVSDFGKFKLGDFGIARQLEKTSSGLSKKGTYTYMAPEVYKGMAYNSTVDIYSLGIVLYRFLNNNRTPFMPPYPQVIKYADKEKANVLRISGEPLPKPCNAEGRLAEIVLKACAYNPNDRYESALEMKSALQSVLYSEQEGKLIYPKGDKLENRDFSASFSNKTDADVTELSTEDDATVLLVDVEKYENNDSEVTAVTDEVDEETITVENIEYEDDATVLLVDVEKHENNDSEATAVIDEVDEGTIAIENFEYEDEKITPLTEKDDSNNKNAEEVIEKDKVGENPVKVNKVECEKNINTQENKSKATKIVSNKNDSELNEIYCEHCGAKNSKSQVYCSVCSKKLKKHSPTTAKNISGAIAIDKDHQESIMQKRSINGKVPDFCPECGSLVNSKSNYCFVCGAKLKKTTSKEDRSSIYKEESSFNKSTSKNEVHDQGDKNQLTEKKTPGVTPSKKGLRALFNNKKVLISIVSALVAIVLIIVCVNAFSPKSIVGVWTNGTDEIDFTSGGDFQMYRYSTYSTYGTYTIDYDNTLIMSTADDYYWSGQWEYEYGSEAKRDSNYWYISGETLYFRGCKYTKK